MGNLLLFIAFSSLLTFVSPLIDVSDASCSYELKGELHQNLNNSGIHLTLHHPFSPCSPSPFPSLPFAVILAHDDSRVRSLASRLSHNHNPSPLLHPSSLSLPLSSGSSLGVGNYISTILLGTPPKPYSMVVDTGSSLNWLQCQPCRLSCHPQSGPLFNPSSSSTYRRVPCSASSCNALQFATLNPSACSNNKVCIYEASYGDSSYSVGYLSTDTFSLASGPSFPNFVFGCGEDNEGLFGRTAGLVGLARNKLSLLSQLAPKLGNSFSYCLPTTSSSGFLSIGSTNGVYQYTPMLSNSDSLYSLKLSGITVGNKGLSVSMSAYGSSTTIIDSGTVITRLPSDVYSALSNAVTAALRGYPKAEPYSILDTCFKGSLKGLRVPAMSLVFAGGAEMKLAPGNVMIDVDESTTCLAFAPSGSVAIIGNRQQQTFQVAYDVANSRIGFAAGGCG